MVSQPKMAQRLGLLRPGSQKPPLEFPSRRTVHGQHRRKDRQVDRTDMGNRSALPRQSWAESDTRIGMGAGMDGYEGPCLM